MRVFVCSSDLSFYLQLHHGSSDFDCIDLRYRLEGVTAAEMVLPKEPKWDNDGAYVWAAVPLAGNFPVHWNTNSLDGWLTLSLNMQRKGYVVTGESFFEHGLRYFWHRIPRENLPTRDRSRSPRRGAVV